MADTNPTTDILDWDKNEKKVPDMLNVLTILTFIGSGIALISSVMSFAGAQKNYNRVVDAQSKLDELPAFVRRMMGPDPVAAAQKNLENKVPILLLGLVSIALCVYGAIQMRKGKKAGFLTYVIGEVLPIVTTFLFIGSGLLSSFSMGFLFLIPLIFIVLYWTQLKYLS